MKIYSKIFSYIFTWLTIGSFKDGLLDELLIEQLLLLFWPLELVIWTS